MYKTIILSIVVSFITGVIVLLIGIKLFKINLNSQEINSKKIENKISNPLNDYSIENLSKRSYSASQIQIIEAIATQSAFTSYKFEFLSDRRKVSGLLNIPTNSQNKFPVIIQARGYVDRTVYKTGAGSLRSGQAFARAGFLTVAPDFLGYGDSDIPPLDIFEERFHTYTTILNLIASLETLPVADLNRIGLWGHSNGGHIMLVVSEVLGAYAGKNLPQAPPLTLWAPVTSPFPYSILYYTNEADDRGKFLRRKLSEFEKNYDVEKFSLDNYLSQIKSPVLIHHGYSDDAVPVVWSDSFVDKLTQLEKSVDYRKYADTDHDLVGAWDEVVSADIEFFNKYFTQ